MKRLWNRWDNSRLYQKFNLLILVAIIFPITVLVIILFNSVQENSIHEKMQTVEYEMKNSLQIVNQNVEMCSLSTQMIINSGSLNNYLRRFCNNESFTTQELLEFNNTEVNSVEKIVNSNPNLYQIRIYLASDTMTEMMPLLYKQERMSSLSWGKQDYPSGSWVFDYDDNIFSDNVYNNRKHIAAMLTRLEDVYQGEYATVEVAVNMETLFPDIYADNEETWTGYVDREGNLYYDTSIREQERKQEYEEACGKLNFSEKEDFYQTIRLDGKRFMVFYQPVNSLGGYLLKFTSLDMVEHTFIRYVVTFILIMAGSVLVLFTLFRYLVNRILRQFYAITSTVHEVQNGNMDVRVKSVSHDEFGELGSEINEMLDRIKKLMEDSVNREVLVKNSQILALQNQINAHFIYNVLESVKMMAEIDEEYAISDAVTALGKLLRYSMRWTSQTVTIEEEVDYIKNYLSLINLRFDYEIYLSINMPKEMWKTEIPKMSLQPIIENAICHGIEELAEDTSIYLKGMIESDTCVIKITDSGKGMTEEEQENLRRKIDGELETSGGSGNGIGLKNVQDRIHIAFGPEYGISVTSKKDLFTQVSIRIPFHAKQSVTGKKLQTFQQRMTEMEENTDI